MNFKDLLKSAGGTAAYSRLKDELGDDIAEVEKYIEKEFIEICQELNSGKSLGQIVEDRDAEAILKASSVLSKMGKRQAQILTEMKTVLEGVVWTVLKRVVMASLS